jgi:hypothetical protein
MANKVKQPKKTYSEKYAIIQVPRETHNILKEYCEYHGYKQGALVSNIIKQHIKK